MTLIEVNRLNLVKVQLGRYLQGVDNCALFDLADVRIKLGKRDETEDLLVRCRILVFDPNRVAKVHRNERPTLLAVFLHFDDGANLVFGADSPHVDGVTLDSLGCRRSGRGRITKVQVSHRDHKVVLRKGICPIDTAR